jgi:hypothetical protein
VGYVNAIGAIETGNGTTGPILNPLMGEVLDITEPYNYTYEFDPAYGLPNEIYATTLVPGGYFD